MSRESYIRGFCKAAEAAGVDPVTLAKYAQQYKTDGYVPEFVLDKVSPGLDIPHMFSNGKATPNIPPTRLCLVHTSKAVPDNDDGRLLAELDPRFAAWHAAHTNAATKALAPLIKAKYPLSREIPLSHSKMLEKIYHDEMKRTTSAPPVSATSPIAITR